MSVSQLLLQTSLISHIKSVTGYNTVWVYDGVSLPTTKPFVTVEQMQNNLTIVSKLRDSVRVIFRFQVGVFAGSASQRALMQDQLRNIFLYDKIDITDVKEPGISLGSFCVDIKSEVPMPQSDMTNDTNKHRVYFNIEVDATITRGN